MAINHAHLSAGDRSAFARVLQKFLQGLKSSLEGDLSNHAVVVGMNRGAKSICDGLRARYSHHCVSSPSWTAHETESDVVSGTSPLTCFQHRKLVLPSILPPGQSSQILGRVVRGHVVSV